ncbi:MAG: mannose-1-phosphate guanylyltransferase/phosphomannomutase [Candidatus Poriferisodalaceae bacterium]|jgi:mannose-1-phosphate guanylyltransferase/phosphomannomutase
MKAVIMAGGEGTRLRPLTSNQPKPLMPIANRAMMEHVIDLLRTHNITDIIVTLAFMPDAIRNHFGDGSDLGVKLTYVVEHEPLGTAGSVRNAAHLLDEPFLVISGDVLTDIDLGAIIAFHHEKEAMVTIGLTPVENPLEFGIVITSADGMIERFLEKPTWGQVFSDTVNTGIFVLDPSVLDEVEPGRQVDFSGEVFPKLLRNGAPLYGAVAHGYWEDVGTLDSYLRAHRDVLDGTVDVHVPGFEVRDGVWLGEGAELHPEATVVGPAIIGANCRVEGGALIGAYSVVGNDTRIRAGAKLERVVLHDHGFVGRNVQLRGAVAGRSCDFRDGCRIEEGAVLGDEVFVGAGAVINQDVRVFPRKTIEAQAQVNTSIVWESGAQRSLFGTEGVSGLANVDLSPELSARLAMAFASTLKVGDTVVASRDTSRGARMLKRAAVAGLNAAGINVLDLETTSLPVTRFLTRGPQARGGMSFRLVDGDPDSALIRLFDERGIDLDENAQRKVERVLQRQDFRRVMPSEVGDINVPSRTLEHYAVALAETVDVKAIRAASFKVVIDYSHGTTASVLPDVLNQLGAEVLGVNPYASTMGAIAHNWDTQVAAVAELVSTSGADVGVVIDPSGERLMFIDGDGTPLSHHTAGLAVLTLLAELGSFSAALPINGPSAAVKIVEGVGGTVMTSKLSASSLQTSAVTSSAAVGVGFDGGFVFPAFLPGYDAVIGLSVLLELMASTGRSLADVVRSLPQVHIARGVVPTPWEEKGTVMRQLIEKSAGREQVLLDGVKLEHDDGWVLCLPDPEEPATRIWAEGSNPRAAQTLVDEYSRRIRQLARD